MNRVYITVKCSFYRVRVIIRLRNSHNIKLSIDNSLQLNQRFMSSNFVFIYHFT